MKAYRSGSYSPCNHNLYVLCVGTDRVLGSFTLVWFVMMCYS
jgi:hypothetical protein